MKKTTILVTGVLAAVALLAPTAAAGKGHIHRSAEAPYENPNGLMAEGSAVIIADGVLGEATFETRRGERFVSAEVVDASGQKVLASLIQDVNGDGDTEVNEDFCGETAAPVAIRPGTPITVQTFTGVCDGPAPAVATSGTITLHFTNRV